MEIPYLPGQIDLAVVIVVLRIGIEGSGSPADHLPLSRQRQTVKSSRRNRHHAAQPTRNVRLAVSVVRATSGEASAGAIRLEG